jgi:hypothetical protein
MRHLLIYAVSLLLGLAALGILVWLVFGPEAPTVPNLALFLVLVVPAVAGILTPFLAWLHRHTPLGGRPPALGAALRQGLLLGIAFSVTCWLQLARLLDSTLVLGLLALVVLLEILAQSRARDS